MNKALTLPFGIFNNDNTPVDGKYMFWDTATLAYRPYNGTAEVLTAIPSGLRYKGLTVRVLVDSETGEEKEFWFLNGIADSDLFDKGQATALPPQIQKARFENLDKILQNMGNLGDPAFSANFWSGIGLNWTVGTLVNDMLPEDALFDAETWDGLTPVYWFAGSSTQGLYKFDVGFVEEPTVYGTSGFGTVYTGVAMTSNNVRRFSIDKVNHKIYFITSETNCFYILDYVNNVMAKKTFTASGTPTRVFYNASLNKVVVTNANGWTIYDIAGSTSVNYTRNSANYTGDLIPNAGFMGQPTTCLVGNDLYIGANTGISPATNQGLWKINISTLVSTKLLNNTQYGGGFTFCGAYGFYRVNSTTGIARIQFSTGTVKAYTSGTYTGSVIDSNASQFCWDERTNQLIMTTTSGAIGIHVFNIATENNAKYLGLIPEDVNGNNAVGSYIGLFMIPDFQGAFSGSIVTKKSSGASGASVLFPLASNPMVVTFDAFGMKAGQFQDTNRNLISPYGLIHKKYVDDLIAPIQAYTDLQGITKHAQGPIMTTGFATYEIGYNSSFPNIQVKQQSIWYCNLEEADLGGATVIIDFLWENQKPKMTVYLLAVNTPTLVVGGILDDTFETMLFLNKDSAGVEWDGLTQTLTLSGDGLYKLEFEQIWQYPKAVFTVEKFPWSY
jgi:hypothetical protein